ncbi:MAG: right-handed parallel beta-helix repeat-containing protein [Pseudoxanthomonas sp.]
MALPLIAGWAWLAVTSEALAADGCTARTGPQQPLQQAIDALPTDGSAAVLCLDKGEYALGGLVSLQRDNTTLRGAGTDTVLKMRDGVQQPLLVIGDYANQVPRRSIQHVAIENLALMGGTAEHEFMPERPYLSNSAVVIRQGQHVRLSGLQASRCRSACLLSEQQSRDLVFERNDVSHAAWDGVSFNSTSHVKLIDNNIHDNIAAGMTAEHIDDSEIRNNRFTNNGSQGIYLSDSERNTFVGNTFTGNRMAGVFLTCAIRYRNGDGGTQCWDNSMSQGNLFEGNRFDKDPYTYTIGVDNAANCASGSFTPNVWRSDNQASVGGVDIDPQRYGYCMRHEPTPGAASS